VPAAAVTPAPVAHRPFVAVKVLVVKTEGEIRGNDVGVWRRWRWVVNATLFLGPHSPLTLASLVVVTAALTCEDTTE
jgi:hypothetical protein